MYYDTQDYVYLRITHHEEIGKCLGIVQSIKGQFHELLPVEVRLEGVSACKLKAEIDREFVQFWYAADDSEWQKIGEPIEICHLSDDFQISSASQALFSKCVCRI